MTRQTMRADGMQMAGAKADLATLLGTWLNCNADSHHITRIDVAERDGALVIHPLGSSAVDPVDWGETEATPYVANGTTEPAGFHARFELGGVRTELAANEKLGILVLQTYTSFDDDSGRMSHFGREFFHLSTVGSGASGTGREGVPFLLGDWMNTNPATRWITGFTLTEDGGRHILRVRAASEPTDWGATEVATYRDALGQPGFNAVYDLGPAEAVLAANTNKGLPIIVAFLRSKDDGETNFLCREFYVRR